MEQQTGKTLSPSQRDAIRLVIASKVAVITGGPGVGKTSTLDSILRILIAKGVQVALAAPTGRAAKPMTEQTGLEAKTIHRLLEIDPKHGGFSRTEDNPLACDLLVVDETSMVDVPLMNALTRAIPPHAGLLLVDDVDQLPSVGPGQVLADVIAPGRGDAHVADLDTRELAEERRRRSAHARAGGQQRQPPRRTEPSVIAGTKAVAIPTDGLALARPRAAARPVVHLGPGGPAGRVVRRHLPLGRPSWFEAARGSGNGQLRLLRSGRGSG